ncbi:MAG: hypothetical protein M3Q39_01770 [Actinomycetota bacterium]|nr:hypothetical protein [Actinomycetota bacterium]
MYDRIIEALSKVNIPEFIDLRRELEIAKHLNPHAEGLLQLKLVVLKNAHKNTAEAVKALTHLDLAEEALEFHGILTREIMTTSAELNKPE